MRTETIPNLPAIASARRAKPAKRPGRAKTVLARPAPPLGWDTSDEHELELRRWRGRTEIAAVEALEPEHAIFGAHADAPAEVQKNLRISRHLDAWLDRHRRIRSRETERAAFLAEASADPGVFDVTRLPLLPYQREGMMHLAFGERALLADEMGLGKTIQAIAACELLARRKGIERVLVVCPASLKAEWEEQIARFADRPTRSVFGPRAERLLAYRDPPFFTIVNYEQVLIDADAINETLAPDVVVLDEAQRIKNWHTKTAGKIKSLRSPYAFVLTGTPVENRIDEIYSIVQFLDPELVGPLFRFNRSFYELDARGRPIEYRNLEELRRRVAPVLLRRRKSDVEGELPGRTVKTYFVPMADEQKDRYEEYRVDAARIANIAKRRPLTPKEFERLQMFLACMRMICDTPAILDPTCRVCPKLEELEKILGDLLDDPDRKIIIFSEWERMLALVRELAGEMGVEVAWHTGSVPQQRRREEINRFKQDPGCRLFLSTDSGSVGLNLQVASAVINIDLPWNPAKLEQRIARAWRKNQTRSVTVVNLVTEHSIEHAIMGLLNTKQALADGLLDGLGEVGALKMPSGKGSLIDRMRMMLESADTLGPRVVSAEDAATSALRARHGDLVLRVEVQADPGGATRLLAVLDLEPEALTAEAERLAGRADAAALPIEVVDRATWLTIRRLAATGMVSLGGGARRVLHASAELAEETAQTAEADARADGWREEAARAVKMAGVLAAGGFPEEAPPLIAKALRFAVAAELSARGERLSDPMLADPERLRDVVKGAAPTADANRVLAALRSTAPADSADLTQSATRLLAALRDH